MAMLKISCPEKNETTDASLRDGQTGIERDVEWMKFANRWRP
jgi:hypothetical protein